MGVCCVQKGAISIESNNIYIQKNKKDNDNKNKNERKKNNYSDENNLSEQDDEYNSGPILKLLIQKSQSKVGEKNEAEDI